MILSHALYTKRFSGRSVVPALLTFLFTAGFLPDTAGAQLWNVQPELASETGEHGTLRAAIGWTRIATSDTGDAVHYVTLSLTPEFSFGKVHAGLLIDVLVNTGDDPGGSRVRQSDLKLGHLIRYVRYGRPDDPWFVHAGALDRVTIGHGFILSRYSNQVADQSRRIGGWVRIDRPGGGFEGLVSNFGSREIYGGRAFVRPFGLRDEQTLLSRLSVGATLLIDEDPGRGRTLFPPHSAEVFGLDVEFPLVKKSPFGVISYGDFAKILDGGSGGALGIRLDWSQLAQNLRLSARTEYHILGEAFIPAFFDETYEVTSVLASGQTRVNQLRGLPSAHGLAVEGEVTVLQRLMVLAAYRAYGNRDGSGVFHAEAHLTRLVPRLTLHAVYDKQGVGSLSDIRRLDDRTVALAEALYRLNSFMLIGLEYRWTFAFDYTPDVQAYRPIERFTPKVIFAYSF
jgi:hypothetical protein